MGLINQDPHDVIAGKDPGGKGDFSIKIPKPLVCILLKFQPGTAGDQNNTRHMLGVQRGVDLGKSGLTPQDRLRRNLKLEGGITDTDGGAS